jgi:hypothetical protein
MVHDYEQSTNERLVMGRGIGATIRPTRFWEDDVRRCTNLDEEVSRLDLESAYGNMGVGSDFMKKAYILHARQPLIK